MDQQTYPSFSDANLRNLIECGICWAARRVSTSSRYRRVNRTTGEYYYLDQRHESHDRQRSTVPVWLIHRLLMRTIVKVQHDRSSILARHPRGVKNHLSYPVQDLLEALLAQRKLAVLDVDLDKIEVLDRAIEHELVRQREEHRVLEAVFGFEVDDLRSGFEVPHSTSEFEEIVSALVPMVTVEGCQVTIWTRVGMTYSYEVPNKPDRSNDVASYRLTEEDVVNWLIGQRLKEKYAGQRTVFDTLPSELGMGSRGSDDRRS